MFFSLTCIVIVVTIYVMSVTMYVTSANYICYEEQKSDLFCAKTWVFDLISNVVK